MKTTGMLRRGAFALLAACLSSPALAGLDVTPMVTATWLYEHLDDESVVVLDTRSEFSFEMSHVPGALNTEYPGGWAEERDGVPSRLPEIADIEAFISSLGIGNDSTVVIVPEGSGIADLGDATWIYWVLKYLGHDAVAIVDGGWTEWFLEDYPSEEGPAQSPDPATFVASPRAELIADTDEVFESIGTATILVDARPFQQYTGEVTPGLVTRAGHIPGAISLDNFVFYDRSYGRLKTLAELAAALPPEVSDRTADLVAYCSIGQASSIGWFVLHELLGFENARLYEASMAEWSRRPDLPMVTGPNP